jgi:hypothetical protein
MLSIQRYTLQRELGKRVATHHIVVFGLLDVLDFIDTALLCLSHNTQNGTRVST